MENFALDILADEAARKILCDGLWRGPPSFRVRHAPWNPRLSWWKKLCGRKADNSIQELMWKVFGRTDECGRLVASCHRTIKGIIVQAVTESEERRERRENRGAVL